MPNVVFRDPVITDNPVNPVYPCLNSDKDVQDIQDVRCCLHRNVLSQTACRDGIMVVGVAGRAVGMFDMVIRNGMVYDGRNVDGRQVDVAVEGERIAVVDGLDDSEARETVDAAGLVVAPGFIDSHSHSEIALLAYPGADSKVLQGVTTEIVGNCGLSAAPLLGACLDHLSLMWREEHDVKPSWRTLADYFTYVKDHGGAAVNIASLVGHGNLRAGTIGYGDMAATDETCVAMKRLADEAMADGALGISTGLIYPPGVFATTDELAAVARSAARSGGIYTSHIRSENDRLLEAVDETIDIARRAEVPVHISHIKASRKRNWDKLPRALEAIDSARREGLDVTCDCYPYTASWTDLDALLPHWTYDGGPEKELARLEDPATRRRIEAALNARAPDPAFRKRVMVSWAGDGDTDIEGLTIAEIAAVRDVSPTTAFMDILIEHKLLASGVFFFMEEENVRVALRYRHSTIGSDSSVRPVPAPAGNGKPHPRAAGTFPRVLGKYVREGVLTLGEAICKMTGATADRFSLKDRGTVAPGSYADLVVFDPTKICDLATYEDPGRPPAGIERVWVNGTLVVESGRVTGARPGRVLHHGG